MERADVMYDIGGFGPNSLTLLCRQAIRDIEEVSEAINELNWMFSDCPAYVRPLVYRGFRARMGIGLKDWERSMDAMLDLHRDLERAVLGLDPDQFMDEALTFLERYDQSMRMLNQLYINLSGMVKDAREYLAEGEANEAVEEMVDKEIEAIATLITTLEMLRHPLLKRTGRG
jgi:hypothetical protein